MFNGVNPKSINDIFFFVMASHIFVSEHPQLKVFYSVSSMKKLSISGKIVSKDASCGFTR